MECEKVREKFSFLVERELNRLEEKNLREHLASCSACQKDFEQFEKTVNWLHSLKEEEVPKGFLAEIYQKMEDRKRMGPRQEWVHRLMQFKLPAQAMAMVAIVFLVLYLTKMMPVEAPHQRGVDVASTPRSEVKTEPRSLQEEVKKEKQEVAFLAEAPRPKKREQEEPPLSRKEAVEKAAVQKERDKARGAGASFSKGEVPQMKGSEKAEGFAPESGKVEKGVTLGRIASLADKPPQEFIVRISDQEKALSQLHEMVNRFGGEVLKEEGNLVLASLPSRSLPGFKKELEGMSTAKKVGSAALQKEAPRTLSPSPSAREEKIAEKEIQLEPSRADQASHITVRIRLLKE
jgi:hypothetical protein